MGVNVISLGSATHTLCTRLPPKIEEVNRGHMGLQIGCYPSMARDRSLILLKLCQNKYSSDPLFLLAIQQTVDIRDRE